MLEKQAIQYIQTILLNQKKEKEKNPPKKKRTLNQKEKILQDTKFQTIYQIYQMDTQTHTPPDSFLQYNAV